MNGAVLHTTDGESWKPIDIGTRGWLTAVWLTADQLLIAGHDGLLVQRAR